MSLGHRKVLARTDLGQVANGGDIVDNDIHSGVGAMGYVVKGRDLVALLVC